MFSFSKSTRLLENKKSYFNYPGISAAGGERGDNLITLMTCEYLEQFRQTFLFSLVCSGPFSGTAVSPGEVILALDGTPVAILCNPSTWFADLFAFSVKFCVFGVSGN